jgi:hypothetical protein
MSGFLAVVRHGNTTAEDMDDPMEHLRSPFLWIVLVQIFYALSTAPIRSSLAAALLPLTLKSPNPFNKYILKGVIAATCITSIVTVIAVCTQAKPLELLWNHDHSTGEMKAHLDIHWFNFFIATVSIILDLIIAYMPYRLLWGPLMTKTYKEKLSLCILLAFGTCGCLAALAALNLSFKYHHPTTANVLRGRSKMSVSHILELAFGMIGGSLSALVPIPQMIKAARQKKRDRRSTAESALEMAPPVKAVPVPVQTEATEATLTTQGSGLEVKTSGPGQAGQDPDAITPVVAQ